MATQAKAGDEGLIGQLERLTAEVEHCPDPEARRLAESLAAAVLEMHGEAFERMLGTMDAEARAELAADGLVGSLLLIHGLFPESIEDRVQQGLDSVRPYMESHGGDVELLGIEEGVAHLRLKGSCDGCAASASTLELAVEKAVRENAPDLLGMEVEGAVPASTVTGTPLPMVEVVNGEQVVASAPRSLTEWAALDGVDDLEPDQLRRVQVGAEVFLVANVDSSMLAYRDSCASCGEPIADGELSEGVLACGACGRQFFLPRAGRSLDDDKLQLEPIPLLAERGAGIKVALPA